MAEELQKENQLEETGQPSPKEATELPELTPEQIAGMKPEELVDYYANAKNAIASATKKWEEAAAMRRQAEEATEYAERMRQESIKQQQEWLDQLRESYSQQPTYQQTPVESPAPEFDQNPDKAFNYVLNELKSTKDEFKNYREQSETRYGELENRINQERADDVFNKYLEKNVFSKYEGVSRRDIDDYFNNHRELPVNDKTLDRAAREIHDTQELEINKRVELKLEELKKKEELAKQATIKPGAQIGSIPPGKSILDLSDEEQALLAEEMAKRIQQG